MIEDNYFRRVGRTELGNASVRRDGPRAPPPLPTTASPHYFSPENLARFNESISGRFSGVGLSVSEVKRGLRVGRVFARIARRTGRDRGRRH